MHSEALIVLGAYNGSAHLPDQLQSIINQSVENWQLLIRDDGSRDEACNNIIKSYCERDSRIRQVEDNSETLGAAANFSYLLNIAKETSADYLFFSDQDDVWDANKVSMQLELLNGLKTKYSESTPLLVHSDLEVVDNNLNTIALSMMDYQGIQNERDDSLNVLLTQNYITGCTTMVNRALLDVALPMPKEVLMHDWWLALCAAVFGKIEYIDKPLVKYRQHGSNEVGAKRFRSFLNPFTGEWKKRWLEGRDNLFQSMKQAEVLAERIRQYDPNNQYLELIDAYAELYSLSRLHRFQRLRQLGIHAQSNIRQALLLSRLLLTSKRKYE